MIVSDSLPALSAGRVRLRELNDDDLPALFAIFSHPEVTRYWSSPPMADEAAAARLLEEIRDAVRRRTLFEWGVTRTGDDRVIGTCTLSDLDAANRRAEIGYSLNREHWGRGYMAEALTALLDYAFRDLGLRRIEADVDPRNAASIRSLERLGFRYEGLLRERWCVNDEVQDSAMYGLLAREWTAARTA